MSNNKLRHNNEIGSAIFEVFTNRGWAFYNYSALDQLVGKKPSDEQFRETLRQIIRGGPLDKLKREVIQGVLPLCDEPDNMGAIDAALRRIGTSCPTISPPYDLIVGAIRNVRHFPEGRPESTNIAMAYEGGKPFPFAGIRPHFENIEVFEANHKVALVLEYQSFIRVLETLSRARPSRQVL